MNKLNFPEYSFKIKTIKKKQYIFDSVRKKYVVLTPEEWVRQNFIQYLIQDKGYPSSLICIEKYFTYNKLSKRADILVYNRKGEVVLIVECKSTTVKVTQSVFDQIARYNMNFRVKYLIITNGIDHYCCKMEYKENSYNFIKEIPDFEEL